MDRLCLDLYRCHRCIYEFDHSDDSKCATESKYRVFFNDDTGNIACLPANTPCQMAQCECDRAFAIKIADLWTNQDVNRKEDYVFNKYYWKDYKNSQKIPTFGYRATCVPNPNAGNSANSCCGAPGEKRPFNNFISNCCANDIKPFGSC